jgi:hypothetical protein
MTLVSLTYCVFAGIVSMVSFFSSTDNCIRDVCANNGVNFRSHDRLVQGHCDKHLFCFAGRGFQDKSLGIYWLPRLAYCPEFCRTPTVHMFISHSIINHTLE